MPSFKISNRTLPGGYFEITSIFAHILYSKHLTRSNARLHTTHNHRPKLVRCGRKGKPYVRTLTNITVVFK